MNLLEVVFFVPLNSAVASDAGVGASSAAPDAGGVGVGFRSKVIFIVCFCILRFFIHITNKYKFIIKFSQLSHFGILEIAALNELPVIVQPVMGVPF